jgi:YVTN family beta-propeller protein
MLRPLVFGALGVAGMAGGRFLATGVVGRPEQGPGCLLAQGTDHRGGPSPIPRANEARGQESMKTHRGASAVLRAVADIPLPGRPVRFDYQSQDPRSGRLYISHMSDAHVVVFDTRTRQVVGQVSGTPGVTGVWVVGELKKLYASVTGRRYVAVIDVDNLAVRATPGPIGFPDGIAYAPEAKRVFVSDESGGGELVIDGVTDHVVVRIPIGGEAGNTKYDSGSGCILVAVQTLNQIVAIDPMSAKVVGRYAPEGADHPHGMYVDAPSRLLFVANQGNATLQVVDLRAMQVTATVEVGEDPDVLAFDPQWRRLYVATEGGGLWVYRVQERHLLTEGALNLPHAHTVSVDTSTHLLYLPLQNVDGRPILRLLSAAQPMNGPEP